VPDDSVTGAACKPTGRFLLSGPVGRAHAAGPRGSVHGPRTRRNGSADLRRWERQGDGRWILEHGFLPPEMRTPR